MIILAVGAHFIRIKGIKLSPINVDKIYSILYVLAHIKLGPLRLSGTAQFSYDEVIQEQDVPKHKTTIISLSIRIVRYDRSHA